MISLSTQSPLAFDCHLRFFPSRERFAKSRQKLAGAMETLPLIAQAAIFDLALGLVKAVPDLRDGWRPHKQGAAMLTLPLLNLDGYYEGLLAIDLEDRTRFLLRDHRSLTPVIGDAALNCAQEMTPHRVTLYETPLDWLSGWMAHYREFPPEDGRGENPPAGGMGMTSPAFDGVCLLDQEAPLLPIFRYIGEIRCADRAFAEVITRRLQAEITAERALVKYPKVTIPAAPKAA